MEEKKILNGVRCFLLDMDGTFYLGNHVLPGALDFMRTLEKKEIKYLFLTNNSSKNSKRYALKIRSLGFDVPEFNIFTSGDAAVLYIGNHFPNASVHVLGTDDLIEILEQGGVRVNAYKPDIALLGYDTNLTFENLRLFCDTVRSGVPYIATHPDINCPTENGFMPDVGSFIELIAASTGRRPDVIIGKPNKHIIDAIKNRMKISLENIAMVGDRLYTDIALGKTGIKTILVLSGETKIEDIENSEFTPDLICENLGDLNTILQHDVK